MPGRRVSVLFKVLSHPSGTLGFPPDLNHGSLLARRKLSSLPSTSSTHCVFDILKIPSNYSQL